MRALGRVFQTDEVTTHALADVDLDVHRGEYVVVSGPSGCGKSTLLSIMGLLDLPTSGEYRLQVRPITDLSANQRRRIRNRHVGIVFQAFNLIGTLTVFENVELPLVYGRVPRRERRERTARALERVGMTHRLKHYPAQLSGGQQQRAAVARAVVGSPALLLADEPTGNLDSASGEEVMKLLSELHAGGTTICMVTHEPRWASHAQREVRLLDGRIAPAEPGSRNPSGGSTRRGRNS